MLNSIHRRLTAQIQALTLQPTRGHICTVLQQLVCPSERASRPVVEAGLLTFEYLQMRWMPAFGRLTYSPGQVFESLLMC